MSTGEISAFQSVRDPQPAQIDSINSFLTAVKNGKWKESVEHCRSLQEDHYKEFKKNMPAVTISGVFEARRADALIDHSGFICMDFDNIDPVKLKERISADPYTYAAFTSLSGRGLAVLIQVKDGVKYHSHYFDLLRDYYRTNFHVEPDKSCRDVSRLRIVSYDPDCYVNTSAKVWTKATGLKTLEKKEKAHRQLSIIATASDFNNLIEEIVSKGVDITNGYEDWLTCGFALAHEFGEGGRQAFHKISSVNSEYDSTECDKQFDHCLRTPPGQPITINSLYYFAKIQGFEVSSRETKEAVNIAGIRRSAGDTKEEALESVKHIEIEEDDLRVIIDQVYDSPVNRQFNENLPLAERVELYVINNYDVKINEIGDRLEVSGKEMPARFPSQVWLDVQKFVDEKASFQLIRAALESNKIEVYNPVKEFFESREPKTTGNIRKLAECIHSDTTLLGLEPVKYREIYLTKWLCGIPASVYGRPNPLVLALCGKLMNTGKTQFYRRLIPKKIKAYYDENSLDHMNDRDNIIKLVNNILILDDEGVSKNYKEVQKFKSLTSRDKIRIRKLHTSTEHEFQRIATLGITSNETDILRDPTGNRRIIPIHVKDYMNFDLYNSIDKEDLFLEAYQIWKNGEIDLEFSKEEVRAFSQDLPEFMTNDLDEGLISWFAKPGEYFVPAPLFYNYIMYKNPGEKINRHFFGKKCSNAGFDRVRRRVEGALVYGYLVDKQTASLCDQEYLRYNRDVGPKMFDDKGEQGNINFD